MRDRGIRGATHSSAPTPAREITIQCGFHRYPVLGPVTASTTPPIAIAPIPAAAHHGNRATWRRPMLTPRKKYAPNQISLDAPRVSGMAMRQTPKSATATIHPGMCRRSGSDGVAEQQRGQKPEMIDAREPG